MIKLMMVTISTRLRKETLHLLESSALRMSLDKKFPKQLHFARELESLSEWLQETI